MKAFYALLDTLAATSPEERAAVEQKILDTYQRRKTVLALDMSGFTLTVRREGILAYLCQIRRMQTLTVPIVSAHQGEVVKCEADNLLAVFDEPDRAVEAAVAMIKATLPDPPNDGAVLRFSIGIDCGQLLLISGIDCFGDPVNLAYKLGEDIARPGEVLITAGVRDGLKDTALLPLREMQLSISGVELTAYGVSFGGGPYAL